MAVFKIMVEETKQKVVEVEADTLTEALASVVADYKNGNIELLPEHARQVSVRRFTDCEHWDTKAGSVKLY